jgi:hypothetical protein
VTFKVRDGDTGQPIAGAQVEANYMVMMDFGVLFASIGPREGKTNQDGNLSLIVDARKSQFHPQVSADGYPDDRDHSGGRGLWTNFTPRTSVGRRDELEMQLFRGERATAEVSVPDNYLGIVLIQFAEKSSLPATPGQRSFSYTATPRGRVEIKETALFHAKATYTDIHARCSDGTRYKTVGYDKEKNSIPDDEVALRFVAVEWDSRIWLYVLGTAAEADAVEKTVWPDKNHFDEAAFKKIAESR